MSTPTETSQAQPSTNTSNVMSGNKADSTSTGPMEKKSSSDASGQKLKSTSTEPLQSSSNGSDKKINDTPKETTDKNDEKIVIAPTETSMTLFPADEYYRLLRSIIVHESNERIDVPFDLNKPIKKFRPVLQEDKKITYRLQTKTAGSEFNRRTLITVDFDVNPSVQPIPKTPAEKRAAGDKILASLSALENEAQALFNQLFGAPVEPPPNPIEITESTAYSMSFDQIRNDPIAWHLFLRGYMDGCEHTDELHMVRQAVLPLLKRQSGTAPPPTQEPVLEELRIEEILLPIGLKVKELAEMLTKEDDETDETDETDGTGTTTATNKTESEMPCAPEPERKNVPPTAKSSASVKKNVETDGTRTEPPRDQKPKNDTPMSDDMALLIGLLTSEELSEVIKEKIRTDRAENGSPTPQEPKLNSLPELLKLLCSWEPSTNVDENAATGTETSADPVQ